MPLKKPAPRVMFVHIYTLPKFSPAVPETAFPIIMRVKENKLSRPFLLSYLKIVYHLFHFHVKM